MNQHILQQIAFYIQGVIIFVITLGMFFEIYIKLDDTRRNYMPKKRRKIK